MHPISIHDAPVNTPEWKLDRGYRTAPSYNDPFELWEMISRFSWCPGVYKGGHKIGTKFIECSWMVLDFDDGEYTLAQAQREWCEHTHVIGTTKSHMKEKKGQPPCERFRLCVPWTETITDIRTLRHNLSLLGRERGADSQCFDGARFYRPCVDLVSCIYGDYTQEVEDAPPEVPRAAFRANGTRSIYTDQFLQGQVQNGHRHRRALSAARELLEIGHTITAVENAIKQAYPHHPWDFGEIERIVRDSAEYVAKNRLQNDK